MSKGSFSQGVCMLTNGSTTLVGIIRALESAGFKIEKQNPNSTDWRFSGPSITLAYLPKVNGYASVDLVNEPWPDSMGDPKKDTLLFGAWSMGHFGPFTFPKGLERAQQHSWSWAPGREVANGHRGFIRIRISYVFGADKDALVLPKEYDPLAEMNFLSHVVLALFKAPGVLCYFNPNGEVLRDETSFKQVWEPCLEQKNIPLSLWMNIRFFKLNGNFGFMDTVGNRQLEVDDVESIFPMNEYEPGDIDYYLRNLTHYLLDFKGEIKNGDAFDGPGENQLSWKVGILDHGLIPPPCRTLRLYPKKCEKEIQKLIKSLG